MHDVIPMLRHFRIQDIVSDKPDMLFIFINIFKLFRLYSKALLRTLLRVFIELNTNAFLGIASKKSRFSVELRSIRLFMLQFTGQSLPFQTAAVLRLPSIC